MAAPRMVLQPERSVNAPPVVTSTFREIPSLYGIRGIAALAVMISHFGEMNAFLRGVGMHAVSCFFVLSGFLITTLMLREHARTGTVSLRAFYWRRSVRIFPAAFAFLLLFVFLCLITGREVPWWALLTAALYVSNYFMAFGGNGAGVTHSWSLSVEEQFYLLWPVTFLQCRQNLKEVLLTVVGMTLLFRFWAIGHGWSWDYLYRAFEQRMDALAIGCLLGILYYERKLPQRMFSTAALSTLSLAAVAVLCLPLKTYGLGFTVSAIAFAMVIIRAVEKAPWWLNNPISRYFGLISYSLYLYHQFADNIVPKSLGIFVYPAQVAVSIVMASASYYLIEKPFLRLK